VAHTKYYDNYSNNVIYFDKEYPTSWIPLKFSENMIEKLKDKGFCILNSDELRDWILKVINEEKAMETIIIFSQDVMPDKVFDRDTPDALIRQYLDAGGRILWFGDIPLWYRGESGKSEPIPAYKNLAPLNILSLIPVITFTPTDLVNITKEGNYYGLSFRWSSHRPVIYVSEKTNDFVTLAKTRPLVAWTVPLTMEGRPVIKLIKKLSLWQRLYTRVKGVRISEFAIEFKESEENRVYIYYEELPCAWIKKFGRGMFIRLWDFPLRKELFKYYENKLINDLLTIINRI